MKEFPEGNQFFCFSISEPHLTNSDQAQSHAHFLIHPASYQMQLLPRLGAIPHQFLKRIAR
jgi:hypothetical protein